MKKISLFLSLMLLICSVVLISHAEWSITPPDAIYITKQQYRSRIRDIMESTVPEKDGWSLYYVDYTNWGKWITNGTAFISNEEDREVRTIVHEAVTTTTGYSYKRYKYYNKSDGNIYLTYGETWAKSHGYSGSWEYKTSASKLSPYKVYDGSHQAYGKAGDFWFDETPITSIVEPSYTEYQYRTREKIYILYRWLDWTDWGDTPVTETDNIEVETRSMYSVNDQYLHSTIIVGLVPEVTVLSGSACQLRYENNTNDLKWLSASPEIAAVSQTGYLSAYKAGQTIVTVGNSSIIINVKDQTDINIPENVVTIESSAFDGDNFESVTARYVNNIEDNAFSNNKNLQLIVADQIESVSSTAFSGSPRAIIASAIKQNNLPIPYYVSGSALPFIHVNSISLSHNSLSLRSGSSQLLTSTILPNDATNKTLLWSSSNNSIVSVSSSGMLQAISPGSATITAKALDGSELSATCNVTVTPKTINGDNNFTLVTADGITQTDATVRFKINLSGNPTSGGFYFGTSSSNLKLIKSENYSPTATVKEVFFNLNKYWGKLSPNTTYYYKLYYVYNEVIYESSMHSLKTLANPTISSSIVNLEIGEYTSKQLDYTVTPSDAQVTWTSSNDNIATVDGSGKIHGVKGGNVSIIATATYGAASASHTFNIFVNPITYRFVLDINYEYTKEQVLDAYDLREVELQEYCLDHPFLGFFLSGSAWINMGKWYPSAAKVIDGGCLASVYRSYIESRGQERSDVHYYYDIGKSSVLNNIQSVFRDSDDNDVNFFFYGGHGSSDGSFYLKTGDHISPSQLLKAFQGIKGHNVFLLSSCYSGAFVNAMRNQSVVKGAVLAACKADEFSYSLKSNNIEYSYDVYYFLRGLGYDEISESKISTMYADKNNDGIITIAEMCSYMKTNITERQTFTYYYPTGSIIIYSR